MAQYPIIYNDGILSSKDKRKIHSQNEMRYLKKKEKSLFPWELGAVQSSVRE